MKVMSNLVKETLPNYLHSLPIPDSLSGWFSLSIGDWIRLLRFTAAVVGLSYLSLQGVVRSPISRPVLKKMLFMLPGIKATHTRVHKAIDTDSDKGRCQNFAMAKCLHSISLILFIHCNLFFISALTIHEYQHIDYFI